MPFDRKEFTMRPNRFLTTIAAGVLGVALLGACSGDSLAEFGLERVLESQSGEDIDIDFSDGGFDISTDEGDFAINFDPENGSIVFDGDEGSGVIQFDDQGTVRFDTDEGSGTVQFDDNGVVFDTDDGSGTVQFDDNGVVFDSDEGESFSIETDESTGVTIVETADGRAVSAPTVPADWPTLLGAPATLDTTQSNFTVSTSDGETAYMALLAHSVDEAFADEVAARLESAGFDRTSNATTTEGGVAQGFSQWQNGDSHVVITWEPGFTVVNAALR